MRNWPFAKGHGTQNDFVIVNDRHQMYDPDPADVRFLCDRHAGIGADGVLRVVRAQYVPEWDGDPELWFMDYRNADGSVAEMCGNGVRVFARYLAEEGLVSGDQLAIGTRSGVLSAQLLGRDAVRVAMGPVRLTGLVCTVEVDGMSWPGVSVDVGNPHVVAEVASLADLRLDDPPLVQPVGAFPDGVNVEFYRRLEPGRIAMRVFERGVGETRSCGTGTVAAAAAAAGGADGDWRVEVIGGELEVGLSGGEATLTGPAEIVARGEVLLPDR